MQSLNSLSKAYVHHKKEDKLLNHVKTELDQFWDEVTDTKKYVVLEDQAKEADKEKQKVAEKAAAAVQVPPAAATAGAGATAPAASGFS